jgi:hypothetical protein
MVFSTYEGHSTKPAGSRKRPFRKVVPRDHRRVAARDHNLMWKQVVNEADRHSETRRAGELDPEYAFHRTTTDLHLGPPQPEPEQQETHSSESLSLFDELFPEESQTRSKREKAAERKLDKLPAFRWNSAPTATDRRERKRDERRLKHEKIPRRESPILEEQALNTPMILNKVDIQHPQHDLELEQEAATLPSLLVLNGCSKNLEESDFFRLGSRGEHIQGWASGIIKGMILRCLALWPPYLHLAVIPARDRNTLEKLGHYYIICSNHAAARAYQDRTITLHRLARSMKMMEDSGVPIPPGYLQDGEDPEKLLQGFSLVPAAGQVSLRILRKPYRPPVLRLLKEGGEAARITKESKAGEMVIFSVDIGHITQYELEEALKDDGRRRNLHWKLGREEAGQIVKLTYNDHSNNQEEPGERTDDSIEVYRARKKEEYRKPSRYVISFRDRNEARRFVREWHRRPFPVKRQHRPGDEPIPIVNAEILW